MKGLNLVPEEEWRKGTTRRLKVSMGITLALTLLICAVAYAVAAAHLQEVEASCESIDLESSQERIALLEEQISRGQQTDLFTQEVLGRRKFWSDFLVELDSGLSERGWLTEVVLTSSPPLCEIRGVALHQRDVAAFMIDLEQIPYLSGTRPTVRREAAGDKVVYPFSIRCDVQEWCPPEEESR